MSPLACCSPFCLGNETDACGRFVQVSVRTADRGQAQSTEATVQGIFTADENK